MIGREIIALQREQGWGARVIERLSADCGQRARTCADYQSATCATWRHALTTFERSVPEADREAVRDLVKDPFILDFLAAAPVRERDLSKALTDNLARFLRELGNGFAFVGAEVPIRCGDREFIVG